MTKGLRLGETNGSPESTRDHALARRRNSTARAPFTAARATASPTGPERRQPVTDPRVVDRAGGVEAEVRGRPHAEVLDADVRLLQCVAEEEVEALEALENEAEGVAGGLADRRDRVDERRRLLAARHGAKGHGARHDVPGAGVHLDVEAEVDPVASVYRTSAGGRPTCRARATASPRSAGARGRRASRTGRTPAGRRPSRVAIAGRRSGAARRRPRPRRRVVGVDADGALACARAREDDRRGAVRTGGRRARRGVGPGRLPTSTTLDRLLGRGEPGRRERVAVAGLDHGLRRRDGELRTSPEPPSTSNVVVTRPRARRLARVSPAVHAHGLGGVLDELRAARPSGASTTALETSIALATIQPDHSEPGTSCAPAARPLRGSRMRRTVAGRRSWPASGRGRPERGERGGAEPDGAPETSRSRRRPGRRGCRGRGARLGHL